MKKTDTFFIIHNYNYDPSELLKYTNNYIVYDASTDASYTKLLDEKKINYNHIKNTGHNISSYFSFFYDNYENLPDFMCLAKSHMIGRHCTKEFFDRVYDNKFFTYLYSQQEFEKTELPVSSLTMENVFIEINNSWYVSSPEHPHKFFDNVNRLLGFIYNKALLPEYLMFAPGACYIVSKEQVLKNPKSLYKILNYITTYDLNPSFPSEAHMLERILPIIFSSNYTFNEYIFDFEKSKKMLDNEIIITKTNDEIKKSFGYKLKKILGFL